MRLRNLLCDYVLFSAIELFCVLGTSYLCARLHLVCETSFVYAKKKKQSVQLCTYVLSATAKSHKTYEVAQRNKKSQAKR